MPVVNHSTDLTSKLGGRFLYRWDGGDWGEGTKVLDNSAQHSLAQREWDDIRMLTDVTGTQRILTYDDHVRDGVQKGVMQMPEGKPQAKLEERRFWVAVREVQARYGHPLMMMTLGEYEHPRLRCMAAKQEGLWTAILPRGTRPANFDTDWRQWVDALWGPEWGPI